MARKIYTSQEMRDVAKCYTCSEVPLGFDKRDIAAMLRQAADMIERCNWQKSHLDGLLEGKDYALPWVTLNQLVNTEKSIVDFILRGDAWEEEK